MHRDRLLPVLSVVVAWAAASAIIVAAPVGVTAPLGLLLIALVGLVWVRAVHRGPLHGLEMFAAVTAVTLGLLVATALVLNLLPWGLRPTPWAIALALLVTVAAAIAVARMNPQFAVPRRPPRPTGRQAIAIALGISALVGAIAISVVSAGDSDKEHFTELSLVPQGTTRGATSAVLLITNREGATVRYRLRYRTGSSVSDDKLTLKPGDSYRHVEPVRRGAASARLYRGSSTLSYRHVWIGNPAGRFPTG